MIGSVLGLLLGYFWTVAGDALLSLVWVLAALAAASALAIWFGIREADRPATTRDVAKHADSLASRLRVSAALRIAIPFFPRRPRVVRGAIARFRLWVAEELHHELPLILVAGFLFNLSANLYNISYTPYLYSAGLTASAIFLVNGANNFAQTLVYPITGGLANRFGSDRVVRLSTYFRSLGYLATVGFTVVALSREATLDANLIVYALLGTAIAIYTTASSLLLFRGLERRDAGSLLGVNSALGGVAAVAGAGLSGLLSVLGSFRLVFLVAGLSLLASVPIWAAASVAYQKRRSRAVGPGDPATVPVAPERPRESAAAAKPH